MDMSLPLGSMTREMVVSLKVTGTRRALFRMKAMGMLMWLAGVVGGVDSIDVEFRAKG
jgi:hypothetical protein